MLSLLQKSDQAQTPLAWHPNFRNRERLPDTKVVRTQFFVNFAAMAVVASCLLYFTYQEYRINNVSRQAAEWQAQIAANQKASNQALELSQKFADEETKINEATGFLKQRLVFSEFVLQIGRTLPPNLAMNAVELRENGVDLRGLAAGSPDEASGRMSAYIEQLKQDKHLNAIFEGITQNIERDPTGERLSFDLFLRFKGATKK